MKHFRAVATVLAAAFSVIFAVLLFPEIVGTYGVGRSAVYVGLGVAVIWLFYFLLGGLFGRIYASGKEDAQENNTDFV